jgi:hypothetical protein
MRWRPIEKNLGVYCNKVMFMMMLKRKEVCQIRKERRLESENKVSPGCQAWKWTGD